MNSGMRPTVGPPARPGIPETWELWPASRRAGVLARQSAGPRDRRTRRPFQREPGRLQEAAAQPLAPSSRSRRTRPRVSAEPGIGRRAPTRAALPTPDAALRPAGPLVKVPRFQGFPAGRAGLRWGACPSSSSRPTPRGAHGAAPAARQTPPPRWSGHGVHPMHRSRCDVRMVITWRRRDTSEVQADERIDEHIYTRKASGRTLAQQHRNYLHRCRARPAHSVLLEGDEPE